MRESTSWAAGGGVEALAAAVDGGDATVAFSLYPTSVEDLMAVADAGAILPPKTTWFEPQARRRTGLAGPLLTEGEHAVAEGPPSILVIGGPTASGKSALAADAAARFGGIVVNADSMQLYRDLPILTSWPDDELRARAPHRLYGVLDGTERCSAGRWRALAMAEIERAQGDGALPILVGGTGLYLRALLAGLAPVPATPEPVRAAVRALYEREGSAGLHGRLAQRDPEAPAGSNPATVSG